MQSLHSSFEKINTEAGRAEILEAFSRVDYRNSLEADLFFQKYCVGNWTQDRPSVPYFSRDYIGRIDAYQDLLDLLKKTDLDKFLKIHKGTPYCFLAWLFIDIGDYEKGVFYLDLAILEDMRAHGADWKQFPPSRLLILEESDGDTPIHKRFVKDIKKLLQIEIDEYKKYFPQSRLQSLNSFVKRDLTSPHHRTIVTSLYAFLLQQKSLEELMSRRGEESGSIEPFLIHLRKGTIILETMLKETYSSLSGLTLGQILRDSFVTKDSGFKLLDSSRVGSTLEDLVRILIPHFNKDVSMKSQHKWVTISYRLRNVTSHGLPWSQVIDPASYRNLYRHILFSIFYLIDVKHQ